MTLPQHLQALIRLKKAKVEFLLVGAMALDHFMPDMASVYLTGDCDILVRPTTPQLRRALRALIKSGYALTVNSEPLVGVDALIAKRLLEHRVMTRAEKEGSLPIDVMLEAKGFSFDEWWKGKVWFKAGGARLACASMEQVLESKRRAGRSKDRNLLKLVKQALRDRLADPNKK